VNENSSVHRAAAIAAAAAAAAASRAGFTKAAFAPLQECPNTPTGPLMSFLVVEKNTFRFIFQNSAPQWPPRILKHHQHFPHPAAPIDRRRRRRRRRCRRNIPFADQRIKQIIFLRPYADAIESCSIRCGSHVSPRIQRVPLRRPLLCFVQPAAQRHRGRHQVRTAA
jgi:hypothetical protein